MEKLNLKFNDAWRALESLITVLKEPFSIIIRDASIQRFEYTFEALWKYLKAYLAEKEGIVCHSPKACFKSCFSVGWLNESETVTCLEMTDKRNDTSHTYKEAVAENIFKNLPGYCNLIKKLLENTRPSNKS